MKTAVIILTIVVISFAFGAWWGSRDQLCVTAPNGDSVVVYCAKGAPAKSLIT